jgi:hypothetical protein
VPAIDPGRLFAAGRGAAGTMALRIGEFEPNVKACALYFTSGDPGAGMDTDDRADLARYIPGAGDLFTRYNPAMHADALKGPVLLVNVVELGPVDVDLESRLRQAGVVVAREAIPNSGEQTLPLWADRAARWLKGLDTPGR